MVRELSLMTSSFSKVQLGATELQVTRLGLAAGYGADASVVEAAFERGVDLFYWGSTRGAGFAEGLRRVTKARSGAAKLIVQSYARWPSGIGRSVEKALQELRVERADVLLLGWWNLPPRDAILDAAREVVARGRARYVMVSCHHRPTFGALAQDPRVDLLMLRYNAAHPGAERDVFPALPSERPGIVAYTATSWGQLLDPALTPRGEPTPTSADCYRFVLSSPSVHACFTGPRDRKQLDEALVALERGPLGAEELSWMRRVGEHVRRETKLRSGGMALGDRLVNLISGFGFRQTGELGERG